MYILDGFRLKCVFTSMIPFSYFSLNVVPLYTTGSKKVNCLSVRYFVRKFYSQ